MHGDAMQSTRRATKSLVSLHHWIIFSLLTFLGIQAVVSVEVRTTPVITHPPHDTYTTDGVLEFKCEATGSPKPRIHWFHASSNEPMVDRVPTSGSTSGIHVNQHYGILMISNPIRDEIYRVYCNASNQVGWTVSQPPAQGGLAYLDSRFAETPKAQNVNEGDHVELRCRPPRGIPKPKVEWLQGGSLQWTQSNSGNQTADVKTQRATVTEEGSLIIPSVSLADSGDYRCRASNQANQLETSPVRLRVEPRVRFVEKPLDARVRQGSTVKFACRTEGRQLVQWSKQQGIIDPARTELAEGFLLLRNVQPSDAGIYICRAMGSISAEATLIVETPPTFSRTPDDLTVREGQIATFDCVTTGFPKPSIYWELADKTPVFPSEQAVSGRFYLHPGGRLEIRNVQSGDEGKYQCTAHSSIDRIHSSAMLRVLPAWQDNHEQPGIQGEMSGIQRMTNKDSQIAGNPSGIQMEQLGQQHYQFLLAPIISLPPVNQTRLVGDLITLDCELGIPGSRAAPTSADIHTPNKPISSDWTVKWSRAPLLTHSFGALEPLNLNQQRYHILPGGSLQIFDAQTRDTGLYVCTAQATVHLTSLTEPSHTIQSNWTAQLTIVQPGTNYKGLSSGLENPLSPVRNLRVLNVTSTTVTLAWDPTDGSSSEDVTSQPVYWVEFYQASRPLAGWTAVEQNWQANTVKIGGLESSTAYYFLIRPRWPTGRIGWASAPLGPVITQVQTEDETIRTALSTVSVGALNLYPLSPQRLRISWTATTSPEQMALITGYTIYHRPVSIKNCISVQPELRRATAESYCSLAGLDGSNQAKIATYRHRLDQFDLNRQTVINSSPIGQWETVEVESNGPVGSGTFDGNSLIKGLKPFHCYETRVAAHRMLADGSRMEGIQTDAKWMLTFESFPNLPPEDITARWVLTNSKSDPTTYKVDLSWSPPLVTSWNGLLTGYIIYVYDGMAENHETVNVSVEERHTLLKGLHGGSGGYFIQMAALTCSGVGLRSKPLQLAVPGSNGDSEGVNRLQLGEGAVISSENKNSGSAMTGSKAWFQQIWFILLILAIAIVWMAFVIFVFYYCCCRRQYPHHKSVRNGAATGGLIANASPHGDSMNSGNAMVISSNDYATNLVNGSVRQNGNFGREKHPHLGHVQLQPLLQSPSPIKNEMDYHGMQAVEDVHSYGVYSQATTTHPMTPWSVARPPDASMTRPLGEVGVMLFGPNFSPPPPQHLQTNQTAQPNMIRMPTTLDPATMHPMVSLMNNYDGSTGYPGVPLSSTGPSTGYMTYQTQMVPPSQSVTEFSQLNPMLERQLPHHPVALGVSGLPLVAPVAPLSSNHHMGDPHMTAYTSPPTSVTPYATACITQNGVRPSQPAVSIYPGTTRSPMSVEAEQQQQQQRRRQIQDRSHSSSDGSSSRSASRVANGYHQEQDNVSPCSGTRLSINGPNIRYNNPVASGSTNVNLVLQPPSQPTGQSKSESTASTNTRQSEDKQSSAWPSPPTDGQAAYIGQGYQRDKSELYEEDSVYSMTADSIPPPPTSPPPPAPIPAVANISSTNGNPVRNGSDGYNQNVAGPVSFNSNASSASSARSSSTSSSASAHLTRSAQIRSTIPVATAVYDINAESTDDAASEQEHNHRSTAYRGVTSPSDPAQVPGVTNGHHAVSPSGEMNGSSRSNRNPFCNQTTPEESQTGMYAQVY